MTQNPNASESDPTEVSGPTIHKEREIKDDCRYIIFYTFDPAPEAEKS